MKKIYTLLLFTFSFFSSSNAQTFGNEWIQYGQKYYSFEVYSTGIHKLDYMALSAANVPLSSFSTENIQLFGREQEIPIYIEDGGDSSFDFGDYILFYAEKNDGWLDSTLYESAQDVGNPKFSLYNDTIQYFFTWNNSTSNLRFINETDVNFSSYTPSNYILAETFQSYFNSYNEGEKTSDASSSFYTSGEGWGSAAINGVNGYTWDFSSTQLNQIYQGSDAPLVTYKAVSVGVSNASFSGTGNHHSRHTIGTSNFVLEDTIFIGYKAVHIQSQFPVTTLPSSGNSNFKVQIIGDQGALTDYQSINYWSFTYPKIPSLSNQSFSKFKVQNNSFESKIRLDLASVAYVDPMVFVLGDTPRRLPLIPNGGNYSTLIPNSANGNDQTVIYQEKSSFINVTTLSPVNGTGDFTNFANISPEKALLMIYNPALQAASADYAAYRNSVDGGNYNVVLANCNELYQQFGGGIEKHINGIRRFSHYMYEMATEKPVGLFLMGKGIREANVSGITVTGPGSRTSPANFALSLIPSFGQPSSDNCITSNLPGTSKWTPLIPTGRVAAKNNQELADYLNKIKAYEANQDQSSVYNSATKDWQKQILHFVGGSDASQQSLFGSYMTTMEGIIENQNYGGNVTTHAKVNDDPLPPSELNDIMTRIQDGVSLISFFGHAAPTNTGFELNIDEPSNWNNAGKCPIILTNSCYNGNIFQNGISKSEEFVNTPDYGAIGYIGTIGLGIASTLYQYSSELYRQFSISDYSGTLGHQMKSVISTIEYPNANLLVESTCTQMTLNGDPMLKINWHTEPEIEITNQSLTFSPAQLDLTVDSIEINLEIKNLGRSITDTFQVEVTRNFPSTTIDSVYSFFIPKLNYTHNLSFKVPMQANIGIGVNNFNVKVDLPTFVDEQYDEINNNQLSKTLFINVDGIQPVLPYEYAVVPDDSVTLKASTINPIAAFNTYRFEIDTIDFEGAPSPFHRYATVSGFGGVKEINPSQWKLSSSNSSAPLLCTDSTVYFWRVAVDEPTPIWKESSFQYIPNKIGWGQDHFFQFKNNGFNGVLYDRTTRHRFFGPNTKELTCDALSTTSIPGIYYNAYFIDGTLEEYALCQLAPAFYVAIIDPVTLKPWGTKYGTENPNNNFGNLNNEGANGCHDRVDKFFIFQQSNPTQVAAFENLVNNIVPDGYYILVYTPIATLYNVWDAQSPSLYSTFQNLGSDSIVPGRPNYPFAFFCKKGDPSTVVEEYAQAPGENVHLVADLVGFDYIGQESSTIIGPASNWGAVYWKQDSLETPNADTTQLYIRAFDINGSQQLEIDTLFTANDSIINLTSLVDATLYPFIQLGAYYKDSIGFSPAQIDRWHVLYSPLPEAAIDGSTAYTWLPASDSLVEGEDVQFAVDVKNIYTIPMDSLLIRYWVQDENQSIHPIAYARQDSLRVGETFRDTISFKTEGLSGINSFWMEVNPYVNGSLYVTDQPEQQHFNNLLQVPFFVNRDEVNPILDVTFNGRHILNGDIVAPESEILISLKDENPYLIMDDISDTTLFGIYITDPDGIQTRIPFIDAQGNTIMQWIPADGQSKRFKIIFPSYFEKSGKYSMLVQGADRSGNLSGDLEYRVTFEVIHESMITYMMNYPNPFSTSTRFVFTLTGNDVPDEMIIQIMTVSGKVVREITEDQLGPIQIGRNISEYAWDGTDEFGDPLANGVYLYRVKAQINGEDIKHMESGADTHFKKEYGKMYIMR